MSPRPPPWKSPAPARKRPAAPMSDAEKVVARERADAAGRRYPNLVDNMWVIRQRSPLLPGDREASDASDE